MQTYTREFKIIQPDNIKLWFEVDTFVCQPPDKDLVKSVKQSGVIQPVIACSHPDFPHYVVMSGQRRILSAIIADCEVPAIIITGLHPDDVLDWIPILNKVGSDNPIHALVHHSQGRPVMTISQIANLNVGPTLDFPRGTFPFGCLLP